MSNQNTQIPLLTLHALDIGRGTTAKGLEFTLLKEQGGNEQKLLTGTLNDEGRYDKPLLLQTKDGGGTGSYILSFNAARHYQQATIFEEIRVLFNIVDPQGHYHIPLILAPGGYSTYLGIPADHVPRAGEPAPASAPISQPSTFNEQDAQAHGSGMSLHIIDIATGRGAQGLTASVKGRDNNKPYQKDFIVNTEGRSNGWLVPEGTLSRAGYEVTFEIGQYFQQQGLPVGKKPFLEKAVVQVSVPDAQEHIHLVLLLSPWGYSCYRGSI